MARKYLPLSALGTQMGVAGLLMHELELLYLDLPISQENLRHWYFDFETIHPFVDGNGRVGGIIIAAATHRQHGIYLAPGQ